MVTSEVINDPELFYSLRDEWNAIAQVSHPDNPFLRHEWLSSWWKAYNQGKQLYIVRFMDRGRTIGFVPLAFERRKFSGIEIRVLEFMASHWGGMDFILSEKNEECLSVFMDWYYSGAIADILILARMPDSSQNSRLFTQILQENKAKYEKIEIKNARLDLNSDWQTYLKEKSKKFRQELRQKEKKLMACGSVSFRRTSDFKDISGEVSRLSGLSRQSWKYASRASVIGSDAGQEFYRLVLAERGACGRINLSELMLDGLTIAFAIRIEFANTLYAFEISYDQEYQAFSPGLLLQKFLIEDLYGENRIKSYDLGESDPYKARWALDYLPELKFILYQKNIAAKSIYAGRLMMKNTRNIAESLKQALVHSS